jgi:hypothetical protein
MALLSQGGLTGSTIALLRQLAEPDALIVLATTRDGGDPRFCYQRGLAHRIVAERSIDVLVGNGYLLRTGGCIPLYRITDKGRAYLRVAARRGF